MIVGSEGYVILGYTDSMRKRVVSKFSVVGLILFFCVVIFELIVQCSPKVLC